MLEVKRLSGYNSKGNITKRKQKKNKKRNIIRLINYLTIILFCFEKKYRRIIKIIIIKKKVSPVDLVGNQQILRMNCNNHHKAFISKNKTRKN